MAGFKGGDKLEAVLRGTAQKLAAGKLLRVGFLETAKYPDGTNVAQVAFWNEYGTVKSPPRPFFRQTIAARSPKWGSNLGKALSATGYDIDKSLTLVGTDIKGQITDTIIGFTSPPLAASTISAKGFDTPLVDTGQMRDSVAFDIKDGGS